ncbi:hypothetical protein GCM10009123_14860 [Kangiella japonica]|uniref:Uncharacterized protein n=1 Tax=Kangiella japonica TaxID=647384 RepID=A0ABN0T0G4_9GAMM
MIPKSTAKIEDGDFCWIKREDGLFVPFVYICKQGNSRSYFYGGIACSLSEKANLDDLPDNIVIRDFALLHIMCFKENETPIAGNITNKLKAGVLEKIKIDLTSAGIGSKSSVWGHKTILKYAGNINF